MTAKTWQEQYAEYEALLEKETVKSDTLPEGLVVGKLLYTPVADGRAWYQITKVTARTVTLNWREDLSQDDYQDMFLGTGGNFPKNRIEPIVLQQDAFRQMIRK